MFSICFKRIVAALILAAALVGFGYTIMAKAACADWSSATTRVRQVESMTRDIHP
ncbi:MAG: hypothetical protein ABFD92_08385 [Planctomycetaceae bacterium]|nr:hypothetical protein [Planctomycetaceae bacterium]